LLTLRSLLALSGFKSKKIAMPLGKIAKTARYPDNPLNLLILLQNY